MGIQKHSSTGLGEVLGKNTKYVGVSKESYGLTGEILEGFLKEVALEPSLKEREEYEQTDIGGERSRQRVQLEQRPRCRSLPAHVPQLFPGEAWKCPFVPLGAQERAARAKPFICNPVSCPLQFGELLSQSAFLCVSDYGDECRHRGALGSVVQLPCAVCFPTRAPDQRESQLVYATVRGQGWGLHD